ncbi:MAG: DUF3313 domain-containing protein [Desulfobacterales bacterium]|jgi:hypothetical protein|nr:DUF3313 domain-containing protein [Desulfobacterales bacterium]
MKKTGQAIWAIVFGLVLFGFVTVTSSAVVAADQAATEFLGEYAKNLGPGPKDGVKMRWLKPGVDFGKYNKVMLDSVIFFFAADSKYKGMDPQELKELADAFNLQIINALNEKYPIVGDPGPDVLRLRIAVTDLKSSSPVMSGITSVVPVGLGLSLVKKGATGSWSGSGATSIEFMALDSATNDVVAVAKDDRSAAFSERFSKWGSAEEAFKFWGERIKLFMDGAHGAK